MDSYYLLAVLKFILLFIILPISVIGLIFYILKKKASIKAAVFASGLGLTFFVYFIVTDIFPRQVFFERNFEENTTMTIPTTAKLVSTAGNQSIWGFGDYNVSYAYELSLADIQKLYGKLIISGFVQSESWLETEKVDQLLQQYSSYEVAKILTKDFGFKQFDILFLNDDKTIIFNSNKW
jgi:hypothetical protein